MSASFANATNFSTGTNPSTVAVKDINGDGKKDLVVANYGSNNVSVLLNNGNGSFGTATNFAVGLSSYFVAIADFNGDSQLDFVVTNYDSSTVSLLLNDGMGGFGTPTSFSVGTDPISVAVGDFNSDNQLDLVVANYGATDVSVLLNDGMGSFNAATNFTVGTSPSSVAVGDFDNDGKPDLVVANYDSNNVSILLNDGMGSFNAATNFTAGTKPSSVAVGDFDDDGKPDLVVANYDSNNVSVLLNDGMGSFNAATNFTAGTSPSSVAVGDFDNDGKPDLVVANYDSNNVSVLLNDGMGSFNAATNFTAGSSPGSVAVEDFDGDNKLDLVVANYDSNNVSVLLNNYDFNEKPTDLILSAISDDDEDDDDDDDDGSGDGDDDDDDDQKIIGNFTTIDPNQDDEHTYSLVAGSGDTDNDAFIIEGNSLKIKSSLSKSTYNIRVRTTDLGGLSFEKELAVNINDLGFFTNTQVTTIFQLTNITNNVFSVKSKIKGGKAKLSIKIKSSISKEINELCVFAVDDEQGTINGIAPGAEGYTLVALQRSKVIFSSIANLPNGFNPADLKNIVEFNSDTKLRFYMVSKSTTQAVLSGKTSFSNVQFSSATNTNTEDDGFSISFQNLVVNIQATAQEVSLGTGLQGKYQGELIDLREVKTKVKADCIVNREAVFNNFVGFYEVADESGGIDTNDDGVADIFVGQTGYAQAAVRARVVGIDLTVNNQGTANFTGSFEPGSIFAPFIIVNGKPDAIVDDNLSNDPAVYFTFLGANTDKAAHISLLGNNTFGFEDLPSGGDNDYNDVIVRLNLSIAVEV